MMSNIKVQITLLLIFARYSKKTHSHAFININPAIFQKEFNRYHAYFIRKNYPQISIQYEPIIKTCHRLGYVVLAGYYLQLISLQIMQQQASFMKIEGNLESISVGAMVQIIKNEIAQGNRGQYQPFENEYYDERIELTPKNQNINSKIQSFLGKYNHLIKKKNSKIKEKNKEKKESKQDQARKQIGTYNDGSLGAYGGKKYEGLGARNEFDTFRRQKSQNYYQNLQEKSK